MKTVVSLPSVSGSSPEQVFDQLRTTISSHLVLPKHADVAIGLWAAHAHAFDHAIHSPIINFTGPDRQCGKTQAIEVLGRIVPRPMGMSNCSVATLYRVLTNEAALPTLLLDEADSFITRSDEMRGILNAGFNREMAFVMRCVGDKHEVQRFSCWAPKAIAGIGELPDTIASRSVIIRMRRKLPEEKVQPLRNSGLKALGEQLAESVKGLQIGRFVADGDFPSELGDRMRDAWEPLLAIADAVGGEWPELARASAVELSKGVGKTRSQIETLLHDIRTVFGREAERHEDGTVPAPYTLMPSVNLACELSQIEGSPWARWGSRQEPIDGNVLAMLLKPLNIEPDLYRVNAGDVVNVTWKNRFRGYKRASFLDGWKRYLGS